MDRKKGDGTPIEQYDLKGKDRINSTPVGLVTPELDMDTGKKQYCYGIHIGPTLQLDSRRHQVEGRTSIVASSTALGKRLRPTNL